MVKRIGGNRRKTRSIFRKSPNKRGKFSLTSYFQTFQEGEKVLLRAEPSIHHGLYFKRFNGKLGKVAGKRGKCYKVMVSDFGKEKKLLVHPVHLKKYS